MIADILVATGATIWLLFFCGLCFGALWFLSWFGLRVYAAWDFTQSARLYLPDGWDNSFCRAMTRVNAFCHCVFFGSGE